MNPAISKKILSSDRDPKYCGNRCRGISNLSPARLSILADEQVRARNTWSAGRRVEVTYLVGRGGVGWGEVHAVMTVCVSDVWLACLARVNYSGRRMRMAGHSLMAFHEIARHFLSAHAVRTRTLHAHARARCFRLHSDSHQ